MRIDVSVVIPTWNRRDTLRAVLTALGRQTFPAGRFEVLLCDAGSTDGSAEMTRQIAVPNLKWLPGPNLGRAAARNRGIAEARGELVLFTDADVIAEPQWIEAHVAAHARHGRAAVVGCEVQVNSVDEIDRVREHPERRRTLHPKTRRRLSWLFFLTGNASVARRVLVDVGSFDATFSGYGHEDLELGYRLARRGVPIRYEAEAVNYHCHALTFEDRCEKMRLAGMSTVHFYRKHRDPRIALRLGLNPLAWIWHALVPEDGRLWRMIRSGRDRGRFRREVALQHAYLSGVKSAWRAVP